MLPKVVFVCVHNSCRSQIAEALGKLLASDVFESCSAGTEIKSQINSDAQRLVNQRYGIDMGLTQYPTLLKDISPADIVITMGCHVQCPILPCKYREDWGLADPSGKCDLEFEKIIDLIHENIITLKERIANKTL